MNNWMNGDLYQQINERIHEGINGWKNELMNWLMNESIWKPMNE